MAIKVDFSSMKIRFPSGSGPAACNGCGGRGYASYGEDKDGKPFYYNICFEGWNPQDPPSSVPCKGKQSDGQV